MRRGSVRATEVDMERRKNLRLRASVTVTR